MAHGYSALVFVILALVAHEARADDDGQGNAPSAFECEDEGFFPHPHDCKKYYWCLDSSPANLGIVAHAFTCPSGLFFNTKSEACDYPANVACKQKKSTGTRKKEASRPPTTPKPKVTTSTTTEAPTTTTTTTTTTEPPRTSPRITAELLAAALRINEKQELRAPTTPQPDNLDRLLDLVQSLGGIEKLQSLVNNQNTGLNGRRPELSESESHHNLQDAARPCTTHGYFEPSYATPDRQDLTRIIELTTTETPVAASNEPRSAVRHNRRPQFDAPPTAANLPTTANPLFKYVDPTRDFPSHSPVPLNPFSFSYNTPGGRVHSNPPVPISVQQQPSTISAQSAPRVSPLVNDPFFSYNTPGRFAQPTTRAAVATATEPTVNFGPEERPVARVPVRVNSGASNAFRNQDPVPRRQPSRVRVQSTFSVASNPNFSNLPGVLYDEDFELNTQPPAPLTTKKPARRRPPQRAHLRNRQEENPVSALINLPPPNLPQSQPITPAQVRPRPLPPRPAIAPQNIPATLPPRQPSTVVTQPPATIFAGFPVRSSNRQFSSLLGTTPPQPNPTISDLDDGIFVTDFPFYDLPTVQTDPPTSTTTSTTTTSTTTQAQPTTQAQVARTTPRPRGRSRPQSQREQNHRQQQLVPQSPPATTPRPTRRTTVAPVEETGPAVEMDPKGAISCARRGVYAHPDNCGMFVVCAPSSRNAVTYRSYTHHCPAEQVFVEEVGRCRPGNKDRCEVFT